MGAKELGATVVACGGNPLTTHDDIAAFLASQGIHIYAWAGQTTKEYDWCIDQVLNHKPTILTDDGAKYYLKFAYGFLPIHKRACLFLQALDLLLYSTCSRSLEHIKFYQVFRRI